MKILRSLLTVTVLLISMRLSAQIYTPSGVIQGNSGSSTNVGIGITNPIRNLDVFGDVRINTSGNLTSGDEISFINPNGETGMNYIRGGNRCDFRFDGTALKIVAALGGATPPAQNGITVTTSGNVGIGTAVPNSLAQLHVMGNQLVNGFVGIGNVGSTISFASGRLEVQHNNNVVEAAGVFVNTGTFTMPVAYGVTGDGSGATADNVGVSGRASGSSCLGNAYGVMGYARDGIQNVGVHGSVSLETTCESGIYHAVRGDVYGYSSGNPAFANYWAGWFNGDVFYTGVWKPSDRNLKNNIQPLKSALSVIEKLIPSTYNYIQEGKSGLNLPSGKQFGFIAQDIQQAVPELVKNMKNPKRTDEKGQVLSEEYEFSGVDYISLIPILTAGIQEQQAQIESRDAKITDLENRLKNIEGFLSKNGYVLDNVTKTSSIILYQNNPNPFKENSNISYKIPVETGVNNATIFIYDLSGKQIKKYAIDKAGEGSVNIQSGELIPGIYIYSLVCDDKVIDTKKMTIKD